jgi:hypothetical protein
MGYKGKHYTDLGQLCSDLEISVGMLIYYAHNIEKHIRHKTELKSDGRARHIYAPDKGLKHVLAQIKKVVIAKYDYPEYVYALGGNTLRDHALVHDTSHELVKMDIRDFFPTISSDEIYRVWLLVFDFSPEIARLLTKLTTHDYHLQQGFTTSSHLAGVAALPFTTSLSKYCKGAGVAFSQYVDDLNFSSSKINRRDLFRHTVSLVQSRQFAVKRRKTKMYSSKLGKVVTGASLHTGTIRATRKTRRRAADALKSFAGNPRDEYQKKVVWGYYRHLKSMNDQDGMAYRAKIRLVSKTAGKSGTL